MREKLKSKRPKTKVYPVGAHVLALAQAKAHANVARIIAEAIGENRDAGELLACLVNAGLSIELYFKAFMLIARNGEVTLGHDLKELLKEFPPFYSEHFEKKYAAYPNARTGNVPLTALRFGAPTENDTPSTPPFSFATFKDAIASLTDVFVEARYFFEQVNPKKWVVIVFPKDAIFGVLNSLDATYNDFVAGKLASEI